MMLPIELATATLAIEVGRGPDRFATGVRLSSMRYLL